MYIKKEMNWNDIKENSWSGAVQVIEEIENQGREDEAMNLIEEMFYDEVPDETDVNDFICFNIEDMLHLYEEEDEDEEEDEE